MSTLLEDLEVIPLSEAFSGETSGLFISDHHESLLHELCHVTLLPLPLTLECFEEVAAKVDLMSAKAADWNEIKTLACEILYLRRQRWMTDEEAFTTQVVKSTDWQHYSEAQAHLLLLRALKSRATRRRATGISKVIRSCAALARAQPS